MKDKMVKFMRIEMGLTGEKRTTMMDMVKKKSSSSCKTISI
jgi:hypothetical protein